MQELDARVDIDRQEASDSRHAVPAGGRLHRVAGSAGPQRPDRRGPAGSQLPAGPAARRLISRLNHGQVPTGAGLRRFAAHCDGVDGSWSARGGTRRSGLPALRTAGCPRREAGLSPPVPGARRAQPAVALSPALTQLAWIRRATLRLRGVARSARASARRAAQAAESPATPASTSATRGSKASESQPAIGPPIGVEPRKTIE